MLIEKEYDIVNDFEFFLEAQKTDIESFSKNTNISKTTIYNILKSGKTTKENYERIYSYIYRCGYRINKVKEEFLKETNKRILFHGSKYGLNEISEQGSRSTCDFGNGFYLGESFSNAAAFVCENSDSSVYSFELSTDNLKILHFDTSLDWMLAICYYRGTIKNYNNSNKIVEIVKQIEDADIIVAPIADNRMFYIMSLFANGDITSEVAIHSLSASFMGHQYVIKTSEAIKHLKPIEKYYLCKEEKNDYIDALNKRTQEIETKLKMAKRTYRDGLFIEEILK